MKGQFIFEFIVAALMFIMIILFAINYLNLSVSDFKGRFYKDEVQSKVLWVSEVLTNPDSNVTLVDEWPYFNRTKIEEFNRTYCGPGNKARFDSLKKRLNIERKDELGVRLLSMRIMILNNATDISDPDNRELDCGQKEDELRWESEIQRFGIMGDSGDIVVLKIFVGEVGQLLPI